MISNKTLRFKRLKKKKSIDKWNIWYWLGSWTLVIQLQAPGTQSTEILPLDLGANGQKTEPPLPLNIHDLHFTSTIRTWSRSLLPAQLLIFLITHKQKPHFLFFLDFTKETEPEPDGQPCCDLRFEPIGLMLERTEDL